MFRNASLALFAVASLSSFARADVLLDDTPVANLLPIAKGGSPPAVLPFHTDVSKDGRYFVFTSSQSTLVGGVDNGKQQLFLADSVKHELRCLSLSGNGAEFDDSVTAAAISDNGRFVAFITRASNNGVLYNGFAQVYLHDVKTGKRTLCSRTPAGQGSNLDCDKVEIAGNGKFVAFRTGGTNLLNNVSNSKKHLFVFDVKTQTVDRISETPAQAPADADIDAFAISGDGSAIAFVTLAHNLLAVNSDPMLFSDVFVHDRKTQSTTWISKTSLGMPGNGDNLQPAISKNGRYVGFISLADNLVLGDLNGCADGFFFDRATSQLTRCDAFQEGGNDLGLGATSLSNDGRTMVVASFEYVIGEPNFTSYTARVFDRVTKNTVVKRVAMLSALETSDTIRDPMISPDGKSILFVSESAMFDKPEQQGRYFYSMPVAP